ncbi:AMP-binding protein [Actinomadura geliboluensis]|uniref:AMP-binding protein n=1 Tax=Actinomadura geliboluensis TaxID=882440 RepID=UPI003722540E
MSELTRAPRAATDPAAGAGDPLAALDSLGMVEFVGKLQQEFCLDLPAEALTLHHFGSVDALLDLLERHLGPMSAVHRADARTLSAAAGPDSTIVEAVLEHARVRPADPFVTWVPGDDGGRAQVLSFGELDTASRTVAAGLAAGGLRAGERVAVLAGNDPGTIVALLAVLRCGGVALMLSPHDPLARRRAIAEAQHATTALQKSEPATAGDAGWPWPHDLVRALSPLTGPDTGSAEGDQPQHTPSWSVGAGPDAAGAREWRQPPLIAEQPALMFTTSGSTSQGKVVVQSHRGILANARAVCAHHRLGPGITLLGGLPLHHVNGVHFTVMAALHCGAHVVLPERISPLTYRATIERYRPQVVSAVPTVLELLLATSSGWSPPSSLRYLVSAAGPLSPAQVRRCATDLGIRVLQGYGLTETMNFSTTVPVDLSDAEYAEVMLGDHPTIGVALADCQITVRGPDGTQLAEEQIGELCMRGPTIMDGYAGLPDLTAAAFTGGWFHSGDLGYWRTGPREERYYYLTGRIKNVAKVSGESVSLEDLERQLVSLPGVADAGCVAVPDQLAGERLIVAVVGHARTGGGLDTAALRSALAARTSPTAVPDQWIEVEAIPRTATGKLDRRALHALLGAASSTAP